MRMEITERNLPRVLGLWDIVSIVIGGIIALVIGSMMLIKTLKMTKADEKIII